VPFEYISEIRALDFVATVAERGTAHVEMLRTPADLAAWIAGSGLVDDAGAVGPAELERARHLREAMFALLAALIDGEPPPAAARDLVTTAAARPGPRPALDEDGRVRRTGDLDAVLAHLAAEVVTLHDSPDRAHLRWCADDRCTRPFVDRSHGQARRWCGMKGCGDRAKAAAYRRRHRNATATDR
jgi:predicted RNA-binding Zn ribbon-like protein